MPLRPLKHIMVDIETLGAAPDSVILSIGAVGFDPWGEGWDREWSFLKGISIPDALGRGQTVNGATITWWLSQSDATRQAYLSLPAEPLSQVLAALREWYRKSGATAIWGHGVNFDLKILDHAYGMLGSRPPWHFKDERDTRTLFNAVREIASREVKWGTSVRPKHDPLGDAECQVVAVQSAYKILGLTNRPTASIISTGGIE